jgi:transcriptional regulator with XRE-family HTH domain
MGQSSRQKPSRLAKKLVAVRNAFQLSQNELIRRLELSDEFTQARISAYERGVREPPLPVLLKYARLAGVYVDVLIDDELELPGKLPAVPVSEGVSRKLSRKTSPD